MGREISAPDGLMGEKNVRLGRDGLCETHVQQQLSKLAERDSGITPVRATLHEEFGEPYSLTSWVVSVSTRSDSLISRRCRLRERQVSSINSFNSVGIVRPALNDC